MSSLIGMVFFNVVSWSQSFERPNILVILADDLGYADVGFNGSKDILTPRLDSLAKNGVVFNNGFVTHPYCGPSRAGIITGRHQARFGMGINPTYSPFDLNMGLPTSETTFAKHLQNAGYRTGVIGKWHLGAAPPFHPLNRGFDHFYGFLSGGHTYFPSEVSTISPLVRKDGSTIYTSNEGDHLPLSLNNNAGPFKEYLTTALSRNAADFVKKGNDPFMLYLAYNAPHQPLQAPKATIEKYANIKNKYRRTYAAMVDEMDEGIGLVIDALKESGKFENTLIFFLSDNGGDAKTSPWIKEIYPSNYPLRGGKGSMYDGGNKVPFVMHWPKGISTNKTTFNGMISALDIAATSLALAGVDRTNLNLDGVNLMPYLNDESKSNENPHEALFWRENEGRSAWAIRTAEKKLVHSYSPNPELFNVKKDISEKKDISKKNLDDCKELAGLWNTWNEGNKPVRWLQSGDYQKKRQELYNSLDTSLKEKAASRKPKKIIY